MNVNKIIRTGLRVGMALLALSPAAGHASGAAPGLDGVKEVVVQQVLLTDPKAADACGLSRDEMTTAIVKELQANNVPAVSASEAKPSMIGVARVDLTAQVFTVNNQDLDCTSWVEATVSSKSNVAIPPVDLLRSVVIQYWHLGTMVAGGQSLHQRAVSETLIKMMTQFSKQYQLDQPTLLK